MSFLESFENLISKKCNSIIAGTGTGSVVKLGFGQKNPREIPLKNTELSKEQRLFCYEFELLVFCCWRVSLNGKTVGGWRDAIDDIDKMKETLNRMLDADVESINLCENSGDLAISFRNGLTLDLFCDITNCYDSDENYTLYTKNQNITVALNGSIEIE